MGRFTKEQVLECIHGNLIVSCQAAPGEPFFGSDNIVRLQKRHLTEAPVQYALIPCVM